MKDLFVYAGDTRIWNINLKNTKISKSYNNGTKFQCEAETANGQPIHLLWGYENGEFFSQIAGWGVDFKNCSFRDRLKKYADSHL